MSCSPFLAKKPTDWRNQINECDKYNFKQKNDVAMTTAMSLQEVVGSCYKGVTFAILSIVIVALIKKE